MSSRTVQGRACSTPACRHCPTPLRRTMSPHCATSFRTWSGGSKGVDSPAVAHAAVQAAVAEARRRLPALPLFAGGRSFGGRMTSQAQAISPLEGVRGLAFVAFPLHPAGAPGVERAYHLADVTVPILFLQGTRDKLAELHLVRSVVETLGPAPRCMWWTTQIIRSTCARPPAGPTRRSCSSWHGRCRRGSSPKESSCALPEQAQECL